MDMFRSAAAAVIGLTLLAAGPARAQTCPATMSHLDTVLPFYDDPDLKRSRSQMLASGVNEAIADGRAHGLTPQQTAEQIRRVAEESARGAVPQAEQCIARESRNPRAVIEQLKSGSFDFRNAGGALAGCAKAYVGLYHLTVTFQEMAAAITCVARAR